MININQQLYIYHTPLGVLSAYKIGMSYATIQLHFIIFNWGITHHFHSDAPTNATSLYIM